MDFERLFVLVVLVSQQAPVEKQEEAICYTYQVENLVGITMGILRSEAMVLVKPMVDVQNNPSITASKDSNLSSRVVNNRYAVLAVGSKKVVFVVVYEDTSPSLLVNDDVFVEHSLLEVGDKDKHVDDVNRQHDDHVKHADAAVHQICKAGGA